MKKRLKDVKDLAILGCLIALGVVLSAFLQFPIDIIFWMLGLC